MGLCRVVGLGFGGLGSKLLKGAFITEFIGNYYGVLLSRGDTRSSD